MTETVLWTGCWIIHGGPVSAILWCSAHFCGKTRIPVRRFPSIPALMARWGEFCRKHHIVVEAATDFEDGALVKAAGDALHSVGRHEWPGAVYAFDPKEPWSSGDMKEAMEHYLKYLKIEIDRAHKAAPRAAFGDASGGHRYCYLAGADFIRTETMVPHTQHLCSQARPAAESLGSGRVGGAYRDPARGPALF